MMAQLLLDFLQIISFLRLCGLFEDSPKFIEFVNTKVCHHRGTSSPTSLMINSSIENHNIVLDLNPHVGGELTLTSKNQIEL